MKKTLLILTILLGLLASVGADEQLIFKNYLCNSDGDCEPDHLCISETTKDYIRDLNEDTDEHIETAHEKKKNGECALIINEIDVGDEIITTYITSQTGTLDPTPQYETEETSDTEDSADNENDSVESDEESSESNSDENETSDLTAEQTLNTTQTTTAATETNQENETGSAGADEKIKEKTELGSKASPDQYSLMIVLLTLILISSIMQLVNSFVILRELKPKKGYRTHHFRNLHHK